jgi:threonine aldolase
VAELRETAACHLIKLLKASKGKLPVRDIEENINSEDIHFPNTTLVAIENTVNKAGGSCYTLDEIRAIAELCKKEHLKLHLDGARLFNALITTGDDPKEYGRYFDTISICLSKGLGAPVGSVLLCKNEYARKARRIRKVFGGGMRQAGYLAAVGIYALDNNIERMSEDHRRAKRLGEELENLFFVEEVYPVETNIVHPPCNNGAHRFAQLGNPDRAPFPSVRHRHESAFPPVWLSLLPPII